MPVSTKDADRLAERVRAHCEKIGREVNVVRQDSRHPRYVITEKGRSKIPLATFSAHSANRFWRTRAETDLRAAGLLPSVKHRKKPEEEKMARLTAEETTATEEMRVRLRKLIDYFDSEEEGREAIVEKALQLSRDGAIESFDQSGQRPEAVVRVHLARVLDEGGGWKQKNLARFAPVVGLLESQFAAASGNGHAPEPEPEPDVEVDLPGGENEMLMQVAEEALRDAEAARDAAVKHQREASEENSRLARHIASLESSLSEAALAREAQAARIEALENATAKAGDGFTAGRDVTAMPASAGAGSMIEALRQQMQQRASDSPGADLLFAVRREYAAALLRVLDRAPYDEVPEWVLQSLNQLAGLPAAE